MITIVKRPNILSRIISAVTNFSSHPSALKFFASSRQQYLERKAIIERTITEEDVKQFSVLTGDINAVHFGEDGIVHGTFLNSLVSAVIGTKLPGFGTLVLSQNLRYPAACPVGSTVVVTVEITSWRKIITCSYNIKDKLTDNLVLVGDAKLIQKKNPILAQHIKI